jgi:hypothetical protein
MLMNPRYPVYIISKGRWDTQLTATALDGIAVPYRIVVEPQEYDLYANALGADKVLALPFGNLGQGGIPARNWVWERSIAAGAKRHWILDDNIGSFRRLNRNLQIKVSSGAVFRAAEDFVDRYENVAMAGFQYDYFLPSKYRFPPILLNTRIYSCILLDNSISLRWRGRYNEDTDLSLRILKAGLCTVLFNAFIQEKKETMAMRGGNTDELYAGDGRLRMAESLVAQHPDVARVTKKWGRWQHTVNYRPFKRNRLRLRSGVVVPDGIDNYGMVLQERSDDGVWRVIGAEVTDTAGVSRQGESDDKRRAEETGVESQ